MLVSHNNYDRRRIATISDEKRDSILSLQRLPLIFFCSVSTPFFSTAPGP